MAPRADSHSATFSGGASWPGDEPLTNRQQCQWIDALDAGSGETDFRLRCSGPSHDWAGTTWTKASDALKAGCAACIAIREGEARLRRAVGRG